MVFLLLLFLYYLFSSFLFTSYYTPFYYSTRCIRRSPPSLPHSLPSPSRLLKDPARRRSQRFASLFAKKLFRNKFTRAMTLVVVIICAYTYISHVNNIHRCAIMARWTSILYFVLFSQRRIAVVILWVINWNLARKFEMKAGCMQDKKKPTPRQTFSIFCLHILL